MRLRALGSAPGTLLIRASLSLLPCLLSFAQDPQLQSCPRAAMCHRCPGLLSLDLRSQWHRGRGSAFRQACIQTLALTALAGDLILLSFTHLICEVWRVVPTLVGPDLVGPEAPARNGVIFKVKDFSASYFYKFNKTLDHMNTLPGPLLST